MTLTLRPEEPPAGPWRAVPFADVVAELTAAAPNMVLAVDGRGSSGKTTLSARLQRFLGDRAATVHTDDIAWHHSVLDWDALLIEHVVEPFHRGDAIAYRPPGWVARGRPGAVVVPRDAEILIVEGVGSSRRSLAPHLAASVWVQSDEPTIVARNWTRVDAGETTAADCEAWMAEENPFHAREAAWERATVITTGTPPIPHDPGTEIVIADPFAR